MDVLIVGAGLAGSTVAAELRRHGPGELRVALFDPTGAGPGRAYGTAEPTLLMNGPVRAMSAVPRDDRHLTAWTQTPNPDALLPRAEYGRYLSTIAEQTLAGSNVRYVPREVVDAARARDGFTVVDAEGETWDAGTVVLAIGNPLPGDAFLPRRLLRDSRYVADPWSFDGRAVSGDVVCIGSGLTAVDVAAVLDARGFPGRVHFVSRHGLLPLVEDPAVDGLDPATLALDTTTPYRLMRTLRRAARARTADGGDWRAVVEAIRKTTPAIWQGWSLRDRRRFLRHAAPYWSIHRYRVPAPLAQTCARMQARGRLVRHRGRVADVLETGERLALRVEHLDEIVEIESGCIVNCSGPESDYLRVDRPLVQNLLRRGLIRPDALRLGIDATADLRVVGAHEAPWDDLFTLGPPLRGLWYETTAVPEIKEQAARIAAKIAAKGRRP